MIRILVLWLIGLSPVLAEPVKNGFDLAGATIPIDEIYQGGPPRDGIPAIDRPRFIGPDRADYLSDDDRVLGIALDGIARAYPIAVLNWHEVVNDRFGDRSIVVTFCPLCGTGMAFEARIGGQDRQFGVSGLLYNSDVLLYDRDSESLWSQLARQAVTGPMTGTELEMIPVSHTDWADWRTRHPDTGVLSTDTGHRRDYGRDPYQGYQRSETVFFPLSSSSPRYHPKEQVIGLEIDGRFKAYPFVELAGTGQTRISDRFAGQSLTIEYDGEHRTGRVLTTDGIEVPTVIAFWFAWAAFHPDTEVYKNP